MSSVAHVGQPAPDFDLPSTKCLDRLNQNVKLSDYDGRYVEFREFEADVLGISTDSVYSHRAWLQTPRHKNGVEGLRYPLASDLTRKTTSDYGVLIEDRGVALRGLFIINPEGILRYKV